MNRFISVAALALVLVSAASPAHEGHEKAKIDYSNVRETAFGRAADPRMAKRTVRIEMSDQMRFFPSEVVVKRGEIVRLVPVNGGKVMHEVVLGTSEELRRHALHMKLMPNMQHSEPHMAHVAPGASSEIGWQFNKAGEFYFACLLPGHFEAGMVGKVKVLP
jgi:uncharacterized cupredoxin-like copper-binding protein